MTAEQPGKIQVSGMWLPLNEYAFLYRLARTLPGTPTVGALAAELVHRGLTGQVPKRTHARGPVPTITPAQEKQLIELHAAKKSDGEIAIALGLHPRAVWRKRNELGLEPNRRGAPKKGEVA